MKENEPQIEISPKDEEANKIAKQETLLDKIGQKQGGRFFNTVKPEKLFKEFHIQKRRRKPTRKQIYDKAMAYLKYKKTSDAINIDEATPLDESF